MTNNTESNPTYINPNESRNGTKKNSPEANKEFYEAVIQKLLYLIPDSIVILDFDGRITFANANFTRMLNETLENFIDKELLKYIPIEEQSSFINALLKPTHTETVGIIQSHLITKTGDKIPAIFYSAPIYHEDKFKGISIIITDISEITKIKERLEFLSKLSYLMLVLGEDGKVLESNALARECFGYTQSELLSLNVRDLLKLENNTTWNIVLDLVRQKSKWKGEAIGKYYDSEKAFNAEVTISTLGAKEGNTTRLLCFVLDISEHKTAEKKEKELRSRLIHSAKLSSIGLLSAGIAHELNSPLTGILSFFRLRLKEAEKDPKLYEKLTIMLEASEHMAKIINNLTAFSRETNYKLSEINLNDIIESTLSFSSQLLVKNNINIVKKYTPDLMKIKGNKEELQQVILNLITNGRDAMSAGGEFTISTYNLKDENKVVVEFLDNGTGIKEGDLEKIFDPFFTTKSPGEGTGLGLFISKGIVKSHSGEILVESKPGKGARFILSLPAIYSK